MKSSSDGKPLKSLSIVIPAYNESGAIAQVVEDSEKVGKDIADEYEILVVDDGSTDNTGEILKRLVSEYPRLRVLTNERNIGVGASQKRLYREAGFEWLHFIPGDRQVRAEEIYKMLPFTHGADIIIGYRSKRKDPFLRILNSWLYNLLVSILFGFRVHDIHGTKLYRKTLLNGIEIESSSAMIELEIFAKALKKGSKVIEAEVSHFSRTSGKATGNNPLVVIREFKDLFRLYRKLR